MLDQGQLKTGTDAPETPVWVILQEADWSEHFVKHLMLQEDVLEHSVSALFGEQLVLKSEAQEQRPHLEHVPFLSRIT